MVTLIISFPGHFSSWNLIIEGNVIVDLILPLLKYPCVFKYFGDVYRHVRISVGIPMVALIPLFISNPENALDF